MDEDLIERFYGPRQLIRACYLRETDVVLGANRDGDQYWSLARVGCSGHPTNTSLLTIRRVVDMAGLAEEWNRPWTDEQKAELVRHSAVKMMWEPHDDWAEKVEAGRSLLTLDGEFVNLDGTPHHDKPLSHYLAAPSEPLHG